MEPTCSVEGCPEPVIARGWCYRHYDRWRKHGDPLAGPRFRARRGSQIGAVCSVEGCPDPVLSRGWCRKHYQRWRKDGDPLTVQSKGQGRGMPAAERFWSAVKRTEDGHLLWQRPPNSAGYGTLTVNGRTVSAHRFACELAGIPIPDGYEPDHRCGERLCVEVTHLEIVTEAENRRRAQALKVARVAARPTCKHGHPWKPETTYINKAGSRVCLVCWPTWGRKGT